MEIDTYLKTIFIFALAYVIGELIAYIVFTFIRNKFKSNTLDDEASNSSTDDRSEDSVTFDNNDNSKKTVEIVRGLVERGFLTICFINGIFQGLIVFGTLKVATRLSDKSDNISNSYYLIGNMVSILISFLQYGLYLKFQEIW